MNNEDIKNLKQIQKVCRKAIRQMGKDTIAHGLHENMCSTYMGAVNEALATYGKYKWLNGYTTNCMIKDEVLTIMRVVESNHRYLTMDDVREYAKELDLIDLVKSSEF